MNLLITVQQRDALVAYLAKRPFEEVASAVMWLQQLPPAPAQESGGEYNAIGIPAIKPE